MRDAEGNITGQLITSFDVTELVLAIRKVEETVQD
jgi:hypothetical protein